MKFSTLLLALALTICASAAHAADGFLKAVGNDIRDENGNGKVVALRGVNLGGWLMFEAWQCPMDAGELKDDWSARDVLERRFGAAVRDELLAVYQDTWITGRDLDNIAALGMNVVRLPFWYRTMENEDGARRPDAFARLDWLVKQAWRRGIYTILDFHGAPGGQSDSDNTGRARRKKDGGPEPDFWTNETNLRRTTEIWQRVAEHFKDNPAVAAYDLLNEPTGAPNREALWAVYDRLFKAIRAIDAAHIISMEGCWGGWFDDAYHGWGWDALPAPERYGWTNVLYQQHSYDWAWNDLEKQNRNIDAITREWEAHRSWRVPCIVGEWNSMAREDAWKYAVAQFDAHGLGWAMWTYKATHGSHSDSWGLYNYREPAPAKPDLQKDSADVIREKWSHWGTSESFEINPMLLHALSISPPAK